jgi:hypothetical protein
MRPKKALDFEPDAVNYTVEEAIDRFVPTITWDRLRKPANQLLCGCAGAGKTMLLKRISWPAMIREPAFSSSGEFIAFYCDVRELEILEPLFDDSLKGQMKAFLEPRVHAALLATVHLLHSIAENLRDAPSAAQPQMYAALLEALLNTVKFSLYSLSPPRIDSIDAALSYLGLMKARLITSIGTPTAARSLFPEGISAVSPEHTMRAFVSSITGLRTVPPIGLLLDQYDSLPRECQSILNPVLKRENRPRLFAVVACRPFSFDASLSPNLALQTGEDFSITVAEYFPPDRDRYEILLSDIWARMRPEGPSPERILQGGLRYFAELSSRSIRRFLELCEGCGALRARPSDYIVRRDQESAAKTVAEIYRDQLKNASLVDLGSLWDLVLRIAQKANGKTAGGAVRVPSTLELVASDLFAADSISAAGMRLIKKAFEEGAAQFTSQADGRHLSLPSRFSLAPILGPVLRGVVDPKLESQMTFDEIELVAKGRKKFASKGSVVPIESLARVFLSTSFADLPDPRQARSAFERVFASENVELIEGSGLGPGAIKQIADQIRSSQLALVDISHLRPNIILELGLNLALKHRIVPVLNRSASRRADLSPYPFLADMGYIHYDLTDESLRSLLSKVRSWAASAVNDCHILECTLDGSSKLRVSQRKRHVALYYPSERKALWESLRPSLIEVVNRQGFTLLDIPSKPHHAGLDLFDNVVWAISSADRVIVDTSSDDDPDLYGSFGLGFAFGLGQQTAKHVLRIEEAGRTSERGLSMWPAKLYEVWSNETTLTKIIREFLPAKVAKPSKG